MLKLLLDEHISPDVTEWSTSLQSGDRTSLYGGMEKGTFSGSGGVPLSAGSRRPGTNGSVIFVDGKTISPADIGGLVWALVKLARETEKWNWTNRVHFLRR
jgi:hypothetical protein